MDLPGLESGWVSMSDEEPDEVFDPFAVDDAAEAMFVSLMDMNAEMQEMAARRARELNATADTYEEMAHRCRNQAVLEAATAVQLSHQTADLIQAEFGITVDSETFPMDTDQKLPFNPEDDDE
jgi:hypothetical protein